MASLADEGRAGTLVQYTVVSTARRVTIVKEIFFCVHLHLEPSLMIVRVIVVVVINRCIRKTHSYFLTTFSTFQAFNYLYGYSELVTFHSQVSIAEFKCSHIHGLVKRASRHIASEPHQDKPHKPNKPLQW